jgi:hypothetical protein
VAALALLLTLFLPWYQESVIVSARARPVTATFSVTGWGAFSFVEAAVMLVAISVLVLLFYRAEGRAFSSARWRRPGDRHRRRLDLLPDRLADA